MPIKDVQKVVDNDKEGDAIGVHLLMQSSQPLLFLREVTFALLQLFSCIIENAWGIEGLIENPSTEYDSLVQSDPTDEIWSRFLHALEMQRYSTGLTEIHKDIKALISLRQKNNGPLHKGRNIRQSVVSLAFFTNTETWEDKASPTSSMLKQRNRRVSVIRKYSSTTVPSQRSSRTRRDSMRASLPVHGNIGINTQPISSKRMQLHQQKHMKYRRKSVVVRSDVKSHSFSSNFINSLSVVNNDLGPSTLTSPQKGSMMTVVELLRHTNWQSFPPVALAYFNKARDTVIDQYIRFSLQTSCLDDDFAVSYNQTTSKSGSGELYIKENCCDHLKCALKELGQINYYYSICGHNQTQRLRPNSILGRGNDVIRSKPFHI
jgi:hypothetical protein